MIRSWRLPLVVVVTAYLITASPTPTGAQTSSQTPPPSSETPKPPILTLFTTPENAMLRLHGASDLAGVTPFDLPPTATGKYSVISQGPGFARTQGVIYLPPRGQLPFVISEPPGVTPLLILRGLNVPGVGDISCGHEYRGVALATAAAGGTFGAIRSQLFYRDRLDEQGEYAASRAENYRDARNAWLIYTGAVWGVSAIDYWIRPRFAMSETTPSRLTLAVPKVSRGGAVWRSLLVAGAGQEYAGHRTRSLVWLSAVLFSGAGYVVGDYQVNYGQTQVDAAEEQVAYALIEADSLGPSGSSALYDAQLQLQQAEGNLQASEDVRQGFLIAIIGFHLLSLIDASIMQITLPAPTGPKISAIVPIRPDGPAVAVSLRF